VPAVAADIFAAHTGEEVDAYGSWHPGCAEADGAGNRLLVTQYDQNPPALDAVAPEVLAASPSTSLDSTAPSTAPDTPVRNRLTTIHADNAMAESLPLNLSMAE